MTEDPIERCRREIADLERRIRAGETDLEGMLLGLHDWSMELRILEGANGETHA